MADVKLTAKQQRFCDEYLIDLNATQAAIRAGYSAKTAYSIGNENLNKPEIRSYIDQRMAEKEKEEITVGNCVLLLEKDGVSFVSSDCHDKLCVKRGKLKRKGDTMACVPERVVAVIKGEKPDDFHISTY